MLSFSFSQIGRCISLFAPTSLVQIQSDQVDLGALQNVFNSISTIGIEAACIQCEEKLNNKQANEWLINLPEKETVILHDMLKSICECQDEILSTIPNGEGVICLINDIGLSNKKQVQLMAKAGSIYLEDENKQQTPLMSPGQFLSSYEADLNHAAESNQHSKQPLPLINFDNLDLSNCDLSPTNVGYLKSLLHNVGGRFISLEEIRGANFQGASLCNVNFSNSKLCKVDFQRANLSGANFNKADLSEANFSGADLSNADLRGTKLNWANFANANLTGTNLSGENLRQLGRYGGGMLLDGVRFCGVNMSDADLTDSNLSKMSFRDADLSRANLSHASLWRADLRGANLTEAQLIDVNLFQVELDSSTNLKYTLITLHFPAIWGQATSDADTIESENADTVKLLDLINAINNEHQSLKLDLLHQLLDALRGIDVSHIHADLMTTLVQYPNDARVFAFAKKTLLIPNAVKAATSELTVAHDVELQWYLDLVEADGNIAAMLPTGRNGFFIQLMALCTNHPNTAIKERAEHIYDRYLNLEPLQLYRDFHLNKINGIENGIKNINESEIAYVLTNINVKENSSHALLLSKKNISDLVSLNSNFDWSRMYFIEDGKAVSKPEVNLPKRVNQFPLVKRSYDFHQQQNNFGKLLEILHLDKLGHKYTLHFKEALMRSTSTLKLVSEEHTIALKSILDDLLVYDIVDFKNVCITDEHFDEIAKIYHIANEPEEVQAYTLYALAMFFVRYASAYVFGTESESLASIRIYSLALLNKVRELNPAIVPYEEYIDWSDRLIGQKFACAATVSDKMGDFAKQFPDLDATVIGMKPLAW